MSDSPICPECGAALAVRPRRVGRLIICPACSKPVSPAAKTAADLQQDLAEPIGAASPDRLAERPFPLAPSPVAAPPWARLPEPIDPPLPRRRRSIDRWMLLKLAILLVAGLCGFGVFFRALGSFVLQPAIRRPVLFALYAGYWLGTALVAAALFGGWLPAAGGEPEGLRRRFGGRKARWLLAACGVSIMLLVLWLVW